MACPSTACAARREAAVHAFVVVQGEADLLQVVLALHAGGGLADLLDGGQQQADQDGDDGDHDQQFDERERSTRNDPGKDHVRDLKGEMKEDSGNVVENRELCQRESLERVCQRFLEFRESGRGSCLIGRARLPTH